MITHRIDSVTPRRSRWRVSVGWRTISFWCLRQDCSVHGSDHLSRCPCPGLCSVFRFVDVLANKGHHVIRTSYPSQAGVEHEFRHSRRCLNLGLEDIRLQRVQETLLEQRGRHLIRHCLPGLDEHLVRDSLRLRGENCHSYRRKYVEVICLSG